MLFTLMEAVDIVFKNKLLFYTTPVKKLLSILCNSASKDLVNISL